MNTAAQIAAAITANCAAHLDGGLSREAWSAEQHRLWDLAAKQHLASEVMKLVR